MSQLFTNGAAPLGWPLLAVNCPLESSLGFVRRSYCIFPEFEVRNFGLLKLGIPSGTARGTYSARASLPDLL
jgi:hypothetical protein